MITVTQHGPLRCREVAAGADEPLAEGKAPVLLWVHGLGESGLCFERAMTDPALASYRHVAPDLVGYGRTGPQEGRALHEAGTLSLPEHATTLRSLLEHLGRPAVVIGHSMGGVIGQLLCESVEAAAMKRSSIQAFINVEGNLSPGDCGYSGKAAPQAERAFIEEGFDALRAEIYALGVTDAAHRSYYASCCLCTAQAFWKNSVELVELSGAEQLAQRFAALHTPNAFAQGKPSGAPARSTDLLRAQQIEPKIFEPAGHWPFVDQPAAFVDWLARTLRRLLDDASSRR